MVGSQATSQNCDLNDSNGRGWRRTTDSKRLEVAGRRKGSQMTSALPGGQVLKSFI